MRHLVNMRPASVIIEVEWKQNVISDVSKFRLELGYDNRLSLVRMYAVSDSYLKTLTHDPLGVFALQLDNSAYLFAEAIAQELKLGHEEMVDIKVFLRQELLHLLGRGVILK